MISVFHVCDSMGLYAVIICHDSCVRVCMCVCGGGGMGGGVMYVGGSVCTWARVCM